MGLLIQPGRLRLHGTPIAAGPHRPPLRASSTVSRSPTSAQLAQRLRQLKVFKVWDSSFPSGIALARSATASRSHGRNLQPTWAGAPTSHSGRPYGGAARRPGIVWFRGDLRLHDHEALTKANSECSGLLPVYCFDPRDYGRGRSGYEKTGPYRAAFLLQAVADLRRRLRQAGSELIVRLGKPEEVLPQLLAKLGPGTPGTPARVYCHSGVTFEELQVEARVKEGVEAAGGQLASLWANTLHHLQDLPFQLQQLPQTFESFRERTAGVAPRAALPAPEQLRGLPLAPGRLDPGEVPSLHDLGLEPLPHGSTAVAATAAGRASKGSRAEDSAPVGGESEALRRLRRFMAEAAQGSRAGGLASGAAYGSNFASSIAPWLATGCLSPRFMLDEARSQLAAPAAASSSAQPTAVAAAAPAASKSSGGALEWVQYELLWRDFFKYMTRRWSLTKLPAGASAASAPGAKGAASAQRMPELAVCA